MEDVKELTNEQALDVLTQGVLIAQSKGVYSLNDAAIILMALNKLNPNWNNNSTNTNNK